MKARPDVTALRWLVVLCCVSLVACSQDDPSVQACAHDDLEVVAAGASDYVLHSEETVCDDFAHSDKVLLYLVKRGDTRRINVLEYIPSSMRDEPRVTWRSPGRLQIDFKTVEEVLQSYDVSDLQVDIAIAHPPPASPWLSLLSLLVPRKTTK